MEEEIILTDEENEPLLAFSLEQGVRGVWTIYGPLTWAEIEGQSVIPLHEGDATTLPVQVELKDGFLNIFVSRQ